jgi:hypothetical protein
MLGRRAEEAIRIRHPYVLYSGAGLSANTTHAASENPTKQARKLHSLCTGFPRHLRLVSKRLLTFAFDASGDENTELLTVAGFASS